MREIFPTKMSGKLQQKELEISTEGFNSRQIEILDVLKIGGRLCTTDILAKLKTPLSERTLRNELSNLEKQKVIRTFGQTNKRVWLLIIK